MEVRSAEANLGGMQERFLHAAGISEYDRMAADSRESALYAEGRLER